MDWLLYAVIGAGVAWIALGAFLNIYNTCNKEKQKREKEEKEAREQRERVATRRREEEDEYQWKRNMERRENIKDMIARLEIQEQFDARNLARVQAIKREFEQNRNADLAGLLAQLENI